MRGCILVCWQIVPRKRRTVIGQRAPAAICMQAHDTVSADCPLNVHGRENDHGEPTRRCSLGKKGKHYFFNRQ